MKSHVSMEQERCIVCGKDYDTGTILLDKRLRNSMERYTVTGWGLCEEHSKEGFITLIGCSNTGSGNTLKPEDAERTGDIAMVRQEVWGELFNVPPPTSSKFAFVEPEVISWLQKVSERTS